MRTVTAQLGRPRGAYKISDSELMESLDLVSDYSGQMHGKLKKPVKTLQCSKRRAAHITDKLKKTQLCHRVQRCKLGYSPTPMQRGKCDACLGMAERRCHMAAKYP